MTRAGWDGTTASGPLAEADGLSVELRLAADDLAVAILRLVRAVERERAPQPQPQPQPEQPARAPHTTGAPPDGDQCLTVTLPEAAHLLGISRHRLYEDIRGGRLPVIRFGRRVLVARATIERVLATGPRPPDEEQMRNRRRAPR